MKASSVRRMAQAAPLAAAASRSGGRAAGLPPRPPRPPVLQAVARQDAVVAARSPKRKHPNPIDVGRGGAETSSSSLSSGDEQQASSSEPRAKIRRDAASSGNRFAAAHAQLLNNQPTLGEIHAQNMERHQKMEDALPDVVRRLATPTRRAPASASRSTAASGGRGARTPAVGTPSRSRRNQNQNSDQQQFSFDNTDVNPALFDFGGTGAAMGDIQTVQRACAPVPFGSGNGSAARAKNRFPLRQVKTPAERRAEQLREERQSAERPSLTVPLDNTIVNYLATAKGSKPPKVPTRPPLSETANAKPLKVTKFLETQKLNNKEYQLAKKHGIMENIDVDLSNVDAKTRGELINIKRKLKL